MTIGKKITGGYVVMLVMLAIVMVVAFYSIRTIRESYSEFIDVRERLVDGADELRFEVKDQVTHYRGFLLYPDGQKYYLDLLKEDYRQFDEIVERMRKLVLTKEGLSMVNEMANLQEKHKSGQEKVIALAQQEKRAEALALGIEEVRPLTRELINKAEDFRQREMELEAEGREEVTAAADRLSGVAVAVSILALISGLVMAFLTTRTITNQMREAITQLSAASAEILATTTQVASGAAETATAVSETTTTVEEVKQTAEVSNQKAKYVSDSAQKAVQVSQTGRRSVDKTIEGISRIRDQMESIAGNVVRLSEQGQAIGEIIATVNDLAEQSNLLAVNAAIEAAKAGEQGKGFAVVAQEVKSLAEQSKQATAQVRSILGDIQKVTTAAVMATEQGSKAVEAGVKQSTEAGESIRVLADSVSEAAQAATQIAASSQQQLVGMDQVALAMENIKQASTQNVASTRQTETVAQKLHELGQKLKELVGRYNV